MAEELELLQQDLAEAKAEKVLLETQIAQLIIKNDLLEPQFISDKESHALSLELANQKDAQYQEEIGALRQCIIELERDLTIYRMDQSEKDENGKGDTVNNELRAKIKELNARIEDITYAYEELQDEFVYNRQQWLDSTMELEQDKTLLRQELEELDHLAQELDRVNKDMESQLEINKVIIKDLEQSCEVLEKRFIA